MDREEEWIAALRQITHHPAARELRDDVTVLDSYDIFDDGRGGALIVTQDMLAEHSHWLAESDPADVAWKLLAANLSDLAAKGAQPLGVLLGYMLSDAQWNRRFADGLAEALAYFDVPLLGGDTIGAVPCVDIPLNPALPPVPNTTPDENPDEIPRHRLSHYARVLTMTALGRARYPVPSRAGAQAGDGLWVTGVIGDAGAGLALARQGIVHPLALLAAHRRPQPRIVEGAVLALRVRAMLDISDGLLLDAQRLAAASDVALHIELSAVPLSSEFIAVRGAEYQARLFAASAGDDYQLLFTLPQGEVSPVPASLIGFCRAGADIHLSYRGESRDLPEVLGYQHHG